jgi:hypothetical protein
MTTVTAENQLKLIYLAAAMVSYSKMVLYSHEKICEYFAAAAHTFSESTHVKSY